jgi:hypothetical protein
MNEEYNSDDLGIHADSLISTESFNDRKEDHREGKRQYAFGRDFDSTTLTAILTLKDDFGRQLELVSDRQNTMVQSIGIILAFASVLLMEIVQIIHLSLDSIPGIISVVALLTSCLIGIATIWEWKSWSLRTGFNLYNVTEVFNDGNFVKLYSLLLEGVVRSFESMSDITTFLREESHT